MALSFSNIAKIKINDLEELIQSSEVLQSVLDMYINGKITLAEFTKIIQQTKDSSTVVYQENYDDFIFMFDYDEQFYKLEITK
jgi:hypothetical protein